MSYRLMSVRARCARRLRGLAVLLGAAGLALPLLVASGGSSTTVDDVLAAARAQVGDAYLWGGNGPDAWDCSGLTSYVWGAVGGVTDMPRVSGAQQRWAVPVPREQLLPGDLVFLGDPVTHVALFLGSGTVVDASSARAGVVERPLWTASVTRYGRVPRPGMPAVTPWTPPDLGSDPRTAPSAPPAAAPAAAPTAAPTAPPVTAPVVTASATPVTVPVVRPVVSRAPAAPGPSATPRAPTPRPARAAPATPRSTRPAPASAVPMAPRSTTPAPARAVPVASRPVSAAAPARPVAARRPPGPSSVRPLTGLPAVQVRPSSPLALAVVAGARSLVGSSRWSDVGVVREAWRQAGGGALPSSRDALVARGQQVARPDVRAGDLVVYGFPARQVYLYAGSGYMAGRSPDHGRVVVRRVHTGDVRFVRLPARR